MASTSELVKMFETWFDGLNFGAADKSRVRAIKQTMLKVLTDKANLNHFEKITVAATNLQWTLEVYVAAMGSSGMPEAGSIIKMVEGLDSKETVELPQEETADENANKAVAPDVLVPMKVGNVVVDHPVGTDAASKPVPGPIQLTMFDKDKDAAPGTAMDGASFTAPVPAAKPLMDRTGATKDAATDVEITEAEPKGIKAGFKRITSWRPGGKKDKKENQKEAEAEKPPVTPNPRQTYGPNKETAAAPKTSSTGTYGKARSTRSPEPVSGKVVAWSIAILFVVLLTLATWIYWKFGNNQSRISNESASAPVPMGVEGCIGQDSSTGVNIYTLKPIVDTVESGVVLKATQSYIGIKYGNDFIVAIDQSVAKLMSASLFLVGSVTDCAPVQSVKVLTDVVVAEQNVPVQQLAYKIDTNHWSGWIVIATMIAIAGAALLSLFMTGSKLVNIVFFVFAVFTVIFVSATTISTKWPALHFFLLFLGGYVFSVMAGGKEELQEQKESFDAGNQLKLPEAMKSMFESLSKMFGIAGGFDWTYSAVYAIVIAGAGALYLASSPLFRVFENRLTALFVAAIFITLSFLMEAWRRGLPGDWWTFAVGFVGLLDFGVYYVAFNTNFQFSDFSATAIAIFGWLITLVFILGVDFAIQAFNSRTELQRDRMADGMLFGVAMKLIAILWYIFAVVMVLN